MGGGADAVWWLDPVGVAESMGESTESINEMNPELEVDEEGCSSRLTNEVAVGVDASISDAPHQEPVLGGFE